MGPYGIGPWGASYLLIDLGENIPIPQRVGGRKRHAPVKSCAFGMNSFRSTRDARPGGGIRCSKISKTLLVRLLD